MDEGAEAPEGPLVRDTPCVSCGHAAHPFLECGDGCECEPTPLPGDERVVPA